MSYTHSIITTEEWAIPLSEDEQPWDDLESMLMAVRSIVKDSGYRTGGFWVIEERSGCDHLVVRVRTTEDLSD